MFSFDDFARDAFAFLGLVALGAGVGMLYGPASALIAGGAVALVLAVLARVLD